ncbi:MAG: hypothetical protein ACOYWZ_06695, partial [Bacillota bacterium]
MKKGVLTGLIGVFLWVGLAFGDIPKLINYQGKVTNQDGTPVSDGSYSMEFKLYNVPTGGNALWN